MTDARSLLRGLRGRIRGVSLDAQVAMRDLSEDGGAISVRGCRLEPGHRDAGSPTGSSVHLRRGSGERPTCSSQLFTGGRYDRGTQSDTHTGLLLPSTWVPLAWIDQSMHTASSRGRGACDLRYAQRTLNRAADSRGQCSGSPMQTGHFHSVHLGFPSLEAQGFSTHPPPVSPSPLHSAPGL